jgi:hypothetical protein
MGRKIDPIPEPLCSTADLLQLVTKLNTGTKVFQFFVPNTKYKECDDGGVEKGQNKKKRLQYTADESLKST